MMFGVVGNKDHDDCVWITHRVLDAGINFIDTADVYSYSETEEIVGKATTANWTGGSAWVNNTRPGCRPVCDCCFCPPGVLAASLRDRAAERDCAGQSPHWTWLVPEGVRHCGIHSHEWPCPRECGHGQSLLPPLAVR
jgi:hypothetical protein